MAKKTITPAQKNLRVTLRHIKNIRRLSEGFEASPLIELSGKHESHNNGSWYRYTHFYGWINGKYFTVFFRLHHIEKVPKVEIAYPTDCKDEVERIITELGCPYKFTY